MIYVYGIIAGSENINFDFFGLNGDKTFTIPYKNISAVASDVPNGRSTTLEDARTHDQVLRAVMEKTAVVPMAFGLTFGQTEAVENLLKQGYTTFKLVLKRLSKKVQADLRISWDKQILTELMLDQNIQSLAAKVKTTPEDLTLKVELGRKVKSALTLLEKSLLPEIRNHMNRVTDDVRENKIVNDDMILNASFLLDGKKQEEFIRAHDELEKEFQGQLVFQAVLPLPPYNFVDIKIEKLDFEKIDRARRTLGLGEVVTVSEVKDNFTNLARKYHPDLNPSPEAEVKFDEIKRAYNTILEFCQHSNTISRDTTEGKLIFREIER